MAADDEVAVVVAGAGARGAYEAGVLSVVLPELAARGAAPSLLVGTSAGAINATLFAALSHLEPEEAATEVVRLWRTVTWRDVFRPPWLTAPWTGLSYLAEVLSLPRPRLTALLDTTPLRATAAQRVNWGQLHENVRAGRIEALATVTTNARGRSVVFVERHGRRALPPSDPDRAIDYVGTEIDASHVLASAAIPIAFPAQRIDTPPDVTGWYTDGGDRLNAPLKPALALGATRLVVVATHPATYSNQYEPGEPDPQPEIDDRAVQVLEAVLVDRMVEDVRTLGKINELVDGRPHPTYRVVPYLFLGPHRRSDLGKVAQEVYEERFGGWRGSLRSAGSPFPILRRLLASTDGPRAGDLLSYLFFDPAFFERAIALGQAHAEELFEPAVDNTVPWRTSPLRTEVLRPPSWGRGHTDGGA